MIATLSGSERRGVIMFVVLMIVLMAGLLAAGLNFYMRSQSAGAAADLHLSQAEEAARSGLNYAAAILLDPDQQEASLTDNPELFRDRVISIGGQGGAFGQADEKVVDWQFSLLRDNPDDQESPAYGISDESGKLNLNAITDERQLLALPGMEPQIAQAILDWKDPDNTPRDQGAEVDYYSQLPQPYSPRNGPFESVEELLLVRGVTPQLLYGDDLNRNGLLEPNENDGERSLPIDDADGQLNPGWVAYLTICSAEPNISRDRRPRLNINTGTPDDLYKAMIERKFSEPLAAFVREARRANMRFRSPAELLGATLPPGSSTGGGGNSGNSGNSTGGNTGRGGRGGRTGGTGNANGNASQEDGSGSSGLTSPLTPEELPLVLEELTCRRGQFRAGLINPAVAAEPVLSAIGFSDDEVSQIIDARRALKAGDAKTFAWLSGVLSEQRFRTMAPLLCGRGWQFRVESVGFSRKLGLFHRLEAVMDLSEGKPRILYSRNLTSLGPAYVLSEKE